MMIESKPQARTTSMLRCSRVRMAWNLRPAVQSAGERRCPYLSRSCAEPAAKKTCSPRQKQGFPVSQIPAFLRKPSSRADKASGGRQQTPELATEPSVHEPQDWSSRACPRNEDQSSLQSAQLSRDVTRMYRTAGQQPASLCAQSFPAPDNKQPVTNLLLMSKYM
jgi:hypothetical protein